MPEVRSSASDPTFSTRKRSSSAPRRSLRLNPDQTQLILLPNERKPGIVQDHSNSSSRGFPGHEVSFGRIAELAATLEGDGYFLPIAALGIKAHKARGGPFGRLRFAEPD